MHLPGSGLLVLSAAPGDAPLLAVQAGSGSPSLTLDHQVLLSLPQTSRETRLPWHDQPAQFAGPRLGTLLEAQGDTLVSTGRDGYRTSISLDDTTAMNAMLTLRCNGNALGIRDQGALLLLLPERENPSTQQRLFRTVWQVTHITIA